MSSPFFLFTFVHFHENMPKLKPKLHYRNFFMLSTIKLFHHFFELS